MSSAKTALSCLIVAASIGCAPALAAPEARSAAPGGFAGGPVAAMRKAEDLPPRLESVALGSDASRPLPAAAQVGNDGRKEQWLRLPEGSAIPEPGLWGLLLAGFLGICAVARPRIFSS